MAADNTHFDMTAVPLKPALEIAFEISPGHKATHYKVYDNKLVFAWSESAGKDFIPFLVPLTAETAVDIVKEWLKNDAVYGSQPDHDGDNSRSWRIYTEAWGHIDHNHYAFVAIEPRWAMYGK